jgi:3alpha(or 20beta)-hydroxysteroid dehydrogenase
VSIDMSEGRLSGEVAIVSGGSRGIGAAVVRRFTAEGARVVIADVLDGPGTALADELGASARYVHLDVRCESDWAAAVASADSTFGPVSVLVTCAGVMVVAPVEQATVEQFCAAFDVNVLGAFLGTRAVIPSMQRAGGGSVVVFSSAAGLEGSPGLCAYAASKAANVSFARTAAMELGAYGIRVNAIAPGGVDTPMSNQPEFDGFDRDAWYSKLPVPRIAVPDDIVPVVLMLASDEARYVTGAVVPVDGGMLAGHPAL